MTILETLKQLRNDLMTWVANNLNTKVTKVEGKGLSTNDYTNEEKNKLASLNNYNDTELRGLINGKANASHKHAKADITDFPTALPAAGGNADTVGGHSVGCNVPANAVFTDTVYDDTEVRNGLTTLNTNVGKYFSQLQGEIAAQITSDKANITVPVASWAANSTHATIAESYPFQSLVSVAGITANSVVDIQPSQAFSDLGILALVNNSVEGGVYIYASEKPTVDQIIDHLQFRTAKLI